MKFGKQNMLFYPLVLSLSKETSARMVRRAHHERRSIFDYLYFSNKPLLKVIYFSLLLISPLLLANYQGQYGQDRYVNENFFHNKRNGFFLDIGAHDGITGSNTYFFEKELGWQGICFEPLPHLFKKLQETRNCICINKCVAAIEGQLPFLHVDSVDEMLSGLCATYDPRALRIVTEDMKTYGGEFKILQLAAVRLDTILAHYGITHIDFLSLDTEGNELEILKSIDFSKITIDVITVENNYNESYINEYLTNNGFTFVTRIRIDDIYINKNLII